MSNFNVGEFSFRDRNPSLTFKLKFMQDVVGARQMTFGEKLVGITFNPSADDKVSQVKKLFAEIADIVDANSNPNDEKTRLSILLRDHTLGEILNAQMNVVKLLTLKY